MSVSGVALLFFIGLIVILVIAVGRGVRHAGRSGRREPGCGRCGYAVAGLTSFECPECGADLRQVGIPVEQSRAGDSIVGVLATWTGLIAVIGFIAAIVAASNVARVTTGTTRTTYVGQDSGAEVYVELAGSGLGAASTVKRVDLFVELNGGVVPASQLTMVAPWRVVVSQSEEWELEGPLAEQMASWAASHGQVLTEAEADDLAVFVRSSAGGSMLGASAGNAWRSLGAGTSWTTRSPPWVMWTVLLASVFVWAGGVWLIVRGRRAVDRQ